MSTIHIFKFVFPCHSKFSYLLFRVELFGHYILHEAEGHKITVSVTSESMSKILNFYMVSAWLAWLTAGKVLAPPPDPDNTPRYVSSPSNTTNMFIGKAMEIILKEGLFSDKKKIPFYQPEELAKLLDFSLQEKPNTDEV